MSGTDTRHPSDSQSRSRRPESCWILGIDTCGPAGSVALGRLNEAGAEAAILNQIELEGRSYSATLIAALGELLNRADRQLRDVGAIVAVFGPGSFTGVRVGLSAAKGLAEAAAIPIVAVSRLEVLAAKAGLRSSALDAHRQEVFLRIGLEEQAPRELLAGAAELAAIRPAPDEIAVCDDAAGELLMTAWTLTRTVRVDAPTAADAIRLALPRLPAGEFADPLLLDGHYLRRSDAEIFGEAAAGGRNA